MSLAPARRWPLIALLISAMFVCYAHRGTLSVAAPFMIRELGLSPAVMGILLSAFFWSYALLQVPAGWLVDRVGVRKAYGWGYLIWSTASGLTGVAAGLPGLIALRVLVGAGQSVAFPASARSVADRFAERERGFVTAAYLAGNRLGQAFIAGIGGLVIAGCGWRFLFAVTGLPALLWLVPWFAVQRGGHHRAGLFSAALPSFWSSLALFRHRSVRGIFLGYFAYDYVWFLYLTWLPGYLVLERNFTAREMGIYSSVPYMTVSLVIVLSGFASDWLIRLGHPEIRVRKGFIVAGLLVGCLIVPAGMASDKMTAVWLLTASIWGLGLVAPNAWPLTQAVCSKAVVGTASGIQNFGGSLGGVVAPALTGYVAHATHSFALAMTIAGMVQLGGIAAYSLLVSTKVVPDPPTGSSGT